VSTGGAGIAMIAALVISVVTLGVAGAVACLAGYAVALAAGQFLSHRLGGITGDVLGAAVELTELAVLLTLTAWGRGAGE
jgi:adenosylcobinamide-GDP ribazoletransferase